MENFIVSARKYRPITFDTVVGQPGITTTLKNAIRSNHLAQAFLFCGPRGVGKTTCARILAKTINCENRTANVEACNVCGSCVSFNNNHSLNIYELDAASNNSVDDIRALVEQVRYPPGSGKYKVYIIDEVHMLSASAFNAFLKTLEEPPSYAVFILATTEKHKIIPTILSRCQIFDFSRISIENIALHLKEIAVKENVNADEDALHIIAQKADGALRDALSMFDQLVSFAGAHLTYKAVIENLNILDYDYYFKITDDILAGNISQNFLTYNEILNNGFDGHHFITGLASHFRDLLVCKDEVTLKLLEVSQNIREKYRTQAAKISAGMLIQLLDISNKCDIGYKQAKNQRLHVELALLQMSLLNSEADKKKVEPVIAEKKTAAVERATPAVAAAELPSAKVAVSTLTVAEEPKSAFNPSKEKPVEKNQQGSYFKKSVSISGSINNDAKTELKNSGSPSSVNEVRATVFDAEQLQQVWNEFATQVYNNDKMALHAAMNKRPPLLKENFEVEFILDHTGLEKDVAEIRVELNSFLRNKLLNDKIHLVTSVSKGPSTADKPYTTKDKFKRMAEKNPVLNELKKQLDLDIE